MIDIAGTAACGRPLYRGLLIVLGAVLLVAISALYYRHDPRASSLFPQCAFHSLTGFSCPGCGVQRAFHCLLHGDVVAAISHNAFACAAAVVLTLHGVSRLLARRGVRCWTPFQYTYFGVVCAAFVMVFWISRNLI